MRVKDCQDTATTLPGTCKCRLIQTTLTPEIRLPRTRQIQVRQIPTDARRTTDARRMTDLTDNGKDTEQLRTTAKWFPSHARSKKMDATATAAVSTACPTCGANGDAPCVTAQDKPARNQRSRRPADAEAATRAATKAQAKATAVAEIEARAAAITAGRPLRSGDSFQRFAQDVKRNRSKIRTAAVAPVQKPLAAAEYLSTAAHQKMSAHLAVLQAALDTIPTAAPGNAGTNAMEDTI